MSLQTKVGRGASDPDANSNVAKVMRMLWEGLGFGWGEVAYSGVTFPLVAPALDHAARLGYRRIVVFPYFLFTGVLVNRIYDAAEAAQAREVGVRRLAAVTKGAGALDDVGMRVCPGAVSRSPGGLLLRASPGCRRAPETPAGRDGR